MKVLIRLFLPLFFIIVILIAFSYLKVNPFKPTPAATPNIGAEKIFASPSPLTLPILLYHYIEIVKDPKDTIRKKLDITPAVFETQLETLSENGYETIFISDIGNFFDGKKNLPQKPIAITFDDGYKDFYTDVFPILKKYNARATAYLIYDFLDKPNYMTKDNIKEIFSSNLVEIGSHTLTHQNLTKSKDAKKEIEESKSSLEALITAPVVSFAYPYGQYNQSIENLVKDAGYTSAATILEGQTQSPIDRYKLKRLRPGGRVGKDLIQFLSSHP